MAALLAMLVYLSACSGITMPKEDMPAAGPSATYGTLVANHLKTTIKKLSPTDPVEIAEPRWVHTLLGWNWLVCVHFQDQGHTRTYSVFIKGEAIADARYSVVTDACGGQTYSSLNLATGAITPLGTAEPPPPLASGGPGPLY